MNKFLIIFLAVFTLTACNSRLSTEELTRETVQAMEEHEGFLMANIRIDSLILTRDSAESNMYTGILQTIEPNGSFTYSVRVTYDGENMTWQIIE